MSFIRTNWKPIAMVVLVTAGYLVKKFAPLSTAEQELLEGLWFALGLGAVFTPNFKRTDVE